MKRKNLLITFVATTLLTAAPATAQTPSKTWNPNVSGGKYRNPVIDADYSDPDVCRVGNDYYMTSSSFACFPGLQILHSTDLVNWELIGAALTNDYPVLPEYKDTDIDWKRRIQHGNYVWAPSIRYHDGWFYIYCGDPDQGLFMTKTKDPRGQWSPVEWVMKGKGLIDCCPLWDDDGKAYLSFGCAGSRAGIKSVLFMAPLSSDGSHVTGPARIIYDGHEDQPTIEGTKLYKRNGYYYIMSPAGGVKYGWQVILRSKDPFGPYEEYVGMAQGKSKINGPHQGAWVDTPDNEDWFIHFQDKGVAGRIIHMQPVHWQDDWPVMGNNGEPIFRHQGIKDNGTKDGKPTYANFFRRDDFDGLELALDWQWSGGYVSPKWYFCDAAHSLLRLYSAECEQDGYIPNQLLQKIPDVAFTATARVRFMPNSHPEMKEAEHAGMIVFGRQSFRLEVAVTGEWCYLRLQMTDKQIGQFYTSQDGQQWTPYGKPFQAVEGVWTGAQIGLYCTRDHRIFNDAGWMDVDYFELQMDN